MDTQERSGSSQSGTIEAVGKPEVLVTVADLLWGVKGWPIVGIDKDAYSVALIPVRGEVISRTQLWRVADVVAWPAAIGEGLGAPAPGQGFAVLAPAE